MMGTAFEYYEQLHNKFKDEKEEDLIDACFDFLRFTATDPLPTSLT